MSITKETFKNQLKALSLENKGVVFNVRCTNYCDNDIYYLKDGKFALATTMFNTKYAFIKNKVAISKLKKDGIYKATEIERTEKNINLYNL